MRFLYTIFHETDESTARLNKTAKILFPSSKVDEENKDSLLTQLYTWAMMDPFFNGFEFEPQEILGLQELD